MRRVLAFVIGATLAACGGAGDDDAPAADAAAADWQWLNEKATAEQYVPATVRFEGREWHDVGIRYKGGYGTLGLCVGPNGQINCDKLSLKLDFAELDPAQRFYGLKKLNLH